MGFTREKRKWLVDMLGEDRVREIEGQLPLLSQTLKQAGVRVRRNTKQSQFVNSKLKNANQTQLQRGL